MTGHASFGAYAPAEIAARVEAAGVAKARLPARQMFVLAMLAGAFIGFGAAAFTMTMTGADPASGPVRVLGGAVFSLGLILVVVGGAELFTGNVLMVMAAVDRRISLAELARAWAIVYAGNLAGAAALAAVFAGTGLLEGPMGTTAKAVAEAKAALPPGEAFLRGVLCNGLVCLAVWLSFAARSAAGKILAVLWPITAFVLLGLEHSVANMYFLPQGWAAGAAVPVTAAAGNLFWVSLGNIAGGAGGVALAYWFAFRGGTRLAAPAPRSGPKA
ncbi:formate/nitrite transporter family protein [Cribrihabitans neustonicus]|uniref:formate/nitrite transporter family protein n=1 Tax=Cribrihabitans neustonicus TaxID=1429085 RepID=UPI003B5A3F60